MLTLITDIDGTLSGDIEGLNEFKKYLKKIRKQIFLVYATGRNFDDYKEIKRKDNLPLPDALILNTGADIYFYKNGYFNHNKIWNTKIDSKNWNNQKILNLLKNIKEIFPQENIQRFKVSFYIQHGKEEIVKEKAELLLKKNKIKANVIISHGKYLDILPENCDKGEASLFLIEQKKIKRQDVVVAGDSENDLDLFNKFGKGIVVANALLKVKKKLKQKKFYFAKGSFAKGLLEGLKYYLYEKGYENEKICNINK
jgi:sucrose-phosphate synthase